MPIVRDLAPIILFVYNRPEHTARTLASLAANSLAANSELIVYADGPKKLEDERSVQAARAVAREARGFKSLRMIERDRNLGLANSIIAGVTEVCETRGRAIVLEDDLIVAPQFIAYMNSALDRYANEGKVMQIAGYMFPLRHPQRLPDAFFLRLSSTWGWATWQRAWVNFETNSNVLLDRIKGTDIDRFDLDGAYPFMDTLVGQSQGLLDVWGIRWYASMFVQDGLCLHPARSLVSNIGMDGSGEHCGPSTAYDVAFGSPPNDFPESIFPSTVGEDQVIAFFRSLKQPLLLRAMSRAKRIFRKA